MVEGYVNNKWVIALSKKNHGRDVLSLALTLAQSEALYK